MSTAYRIPDLEAAQAAVARLQADATTDPAVLKAAQGRAKQIEYLLRANDILPLLGEATAPAPLTLDQQLDRLFPNAGNREEVEHDGKRFRRRFTPRAKSPEGKVLAWQKSWEAVEAA